MSVDFSKRPDKNAAPSYAPYYMERADKYPDLMTALSENFKEMESFINEIPDDKMDYQYADGKWSTRKVIMHIIDTERIFLYRALRLSRRDSTVMEGFDEDHFATNDGSDNKTQEDLALEFSAVRMSTLAFYKHLTDRMLDYVGTASNQPASARSLAWMMVGHAIHHRGIIEERYFVSELDE